MIIINSINEQTLSYQLNICCLNVCGLVSKLLNPDFTSLIENSDILVFEETKTDEFDQLLLPKYYSFRAKHRTKFQKKSGGIIIVFKNYLEPFLHFPDTEILFSG